MLPINEFHILESKTITILTKKRFKGKYKEIIENILKLQESSVMCNQKQMSYSSVMYQVKFLKGQYAEELNEVIEEYQEIIFPDITFKADINSLITGPYALKIWLVRYLCLKVIKQRLKNIIDLKLSNLSITQQYQEIDSVVYNCVINKTMVNN